jgi:formylglycine-generating enzyme
VNVHPFLLPLTRLPNGARVPDARAGRSGRPARLGIAAAGLLGCTGGGQVADTDASIAPQPPWDAMEAEPEPRPGMVWVPPGVLIAGTPPDKIPRVADEEMAGEQVVMRGFYVDIYPYPNEVGAIPTTNITHAEGADLCAAQQKRLCSELELERACKGPSNTVYEYGDAYKPSACATHVARALTPNGVNSACQSVFGVHDLHGGVWSWTSSQWKRDPKKSNLTTIRGGNGVLGELMSRCANGKGVRPDKKREDIGVRCCAGEANDFEVVLQVTRGEPLRWQPADEKIAPMLEKLVPDDILQTAKGRRADGGFKVERMWTWHPLGNEELVIGGGCARAGHRGGNSTCGVVVARVRLEKPHMLAFVPSDWWQPTMGEADSPREVFLYGGDRNGAFRKRVSYAWGKIDVAEKERKRKKKGEREARY